MSATSDQLTKTLQAHGLSSTAARRLIFESFSNSGPLTMQQLASRCLPAINRSSLYRTVELFESLGIIKRLHVGWKYKLELSDAFQPHHHHAICTACGAIITLPENPDVERYFKQAAETLGFIPADHQVELRGICRECAVAAPLPV